MYRWIIWKRRIEGIFIFPFALLGRLIAYMRPLDREFDLFFFFPFFHVGGAEKVHSEITRQFPDQKIALFFTKKSVNDAMLPFFQGSNISVYNVSAYTDNKWLYWMNLIYRGIISTYINRQQKVPVVFNGQCNFAYKLSPHLRRNIRQVELIHSFCSFSFIRIPFIPFYNTTVMISQDAIRKHLALYRRYNIPAAFDDKIQLILNGIPLPADDTPLAKGPLKLLYVGRGTTEKRPHLVAQIARAAGVEAGFVGPLEDSIPDELKQGCVFYGEQTDPQVIDQLYRSHHVIVITSTSEGFPMVIMEGMARGLSVLSTNVGDIPYHVPAEGGFLINADQPEAGIVADGAACVAKWINDPALLEQMGERNKTYARAYFGLDAFAKAWRRVLL